ncbi:MAG: fimbrial protein [Shewanella sp.]
MKLVIKLVPFAIAAALMGNAAQASDGSINFQGRVVDQTCTITVGGVVSPAVATVTLPTVSASLLDAAGKTTGRTDFEIELSSCSGAATTAAAFFEAGADVDPISGQLINRGDATNVRLRLLDGTTPISAGNTNQLSNTSRVSFAAGNAVLPYAVEYLATGAAGAGTVQSTVTYSIDYQ